MATKLMKDKTFRLIHGRRFAAQAATKAVGQAHSTGSKLAAKELKQTKLPNGLFVASLENYSPISRIGVFIRAGARYESADELGVTHCLRNTAGLSTKASTVFGITRNIEYNGGSLTVSGDRENLFYLLQSSRDHTERMLGYVADIIARPAFKPWELKDFAYRMKLDLATLKETPQAVLVEAIHKAAFRGGLGNSIYSPEHMMGHHDHNMLMQFVTKNFQMNRTAVIGLGVEHERLSEFVEKNFLLVNSGGDNPGESKFGGGEIRIETNSDITYSAVVAEGASLKNQKELAALHLFQYLLGCGSSVKYSSGNSLLSQAANKATNNAVAVSSFNASYKDTGIFGFICAAPSTDVKKVITAVVGQMRQVARDIKPADLERAKNQLKSTILMNNEEPVPMIDNMGLQALSYDNILNNNDIFKMIDSISAQDLSSIATKVMKGKGAMASVGKLANTPYLDELV